MFLPLLQQAESSICINFFSLIWLWTKEDLFIALTPGKEGPYPTSVGFTYSMPLCGNKTFIHVDGYWLLSEHEEGF